MGGKPSLNWRSLSVDAGAGKSPGGDLGGDRGLSSSLSEGRRAAALRIEADVLSTRRRCVAATEHNAFIMDGIEPSYIVRKFREVAQKRFLLRVIAKGRMTQYLRAFANLMLKGI
jgi:hypothetical protein